MCVESEVRSTLNDLASLYLSLGKLEESEDLFERTLILKERVLGSSHHEVAAALNRYNVEIVRYEETKGTLLEFFAIDFCGDPCRQAAKLRKSGTKRRPILVIGPHVEGSVTDSVYD